MRFDIPIIIFIFSILDNCVVSSKEIIGGSGKYKFRYRPDLVRLPDLEVDDNLNGHGLAFDEENDSFYFTWQPKSLTNTTHALARFSLSPRGVELLGEAGPNGLSWGVPHGLRLENSEFLYHANNKQRVTKTTVDGSIVWSTSFEDWNVTHPQYWPILPTDAIGVPVRARFNTLLSSPPTQTSIREPI